MTLEALLFQALNGLAAATQIAQVTRSRFMPPWKVEPSVGHFVGQRLLTEGEITQIDQWVKNGTPSSVPRASAVAATASVTAASSRVARAASRSVVGGSTSAARVENVTMPTGKTLTVGTNTLGGTVRLATSTMTTTGFVNVAFGKLQEIISGSPIGFGKAQQPVNVLLLAAAVAAAAGGGLAVSLAGLAVPNFWLALVLVELLAVVSLYGFFNRWNDALAIPLAAARFPAVAVEGHR